MLWSSEPDCAARIRGVLCPDDGVWNCRLDGKTLQIGVHGGPLGSPGDSQFEVGDADAIALVVHYMDVITLDDGTVVVAEHVVPSLAQECVGFDFNAVGRERTPWPPWPRQRRVHHHYSNTMRQCLH